LRTPLLTVTISRNRAWLPQSKRERESFDRRQFKKWRCSALELHTLLAVIRLTRNDTATPSQKTGRSSTSKRGTDKVRGPEVPGGTRLEALNVFDLRVNLQSSDRRGTLEKLGKKGFRRIWRLNRSGFVRSRSDFRLWTMANRQKMGKLAGGETVGLMAPAAAARPFAPGAHF